MAHAEQAVSEAASAPSESGAGSQLTPRQILTAMSGLMIAMLLAQLDNMIVAPALPTIVGDLGGLNHLSWVVTAYILASTIATPIWGKLGDLFGHKLTFMTSIVLFLIGSALCGVSQDMTQLILFRAFQGIGAGGLIVGIMSVIGMLLSPRERGKYIGVMMAVMPAAMIAGPLIGGFITDHASWRWAFYVNIPLGIISLFVIWSTLHLTHEQKGDDKVAVDWAGAAVLTVWVTALILAITWGGNQYAWGSVQILGLEVITVVGLVAFLLVERRATHPIIGLHLFGIRNFSLATAMGFVAGFAMFGAITFLPQFQQFVQGQSATSSGLLLMPMMLSAVVFSIGGGQLISRTGHYKAFPILGTALLGTGLALFSTMGLDTPTGVTALYMVVLGAGMGCLMQTTNLIAQNSVELRDLGSATGTSTFVRNLGGSLGVAALGAIYAHHVTTSLSGSGVGKISVESTTSLTPAALQSLPPAVQDVFRSAVADGTQAIFFWAALVTVFGFVASWFVRQVPLRTSNAPVDPGKGTGNDPVEAAEAVEGMAV
ncbi:MDR family MFS transporter [Marmoricola sp. RAF53]|uniref:MDR family MFS transporter n=1 Tax=Marmoricola sp. RAF53 TaxID=3233059 RepID=UPI003F985B44